MDKENCDVRNEKRKYKETPGQEYISILKKKQRFEQSETPKMVVNKTVRFGQTTTARIASNGTPKNAKNIKPDTVRENKSNNVTEVDDRVAMISAQFDQLIPKRPKSTVPPPPPPPVIAQIDQLPPKKARSTIPPPPPPPSPPPPPPPRPVISQNNVPKKPSRFDVRVPYHPPKFQQLEQKKEDTNLIIQQSLAEKEAKKKQNLEMFPTVEELKNIYKERDIEDIQQILAHMAKLSWLSYEALGEKTYQRKMNTFKEDPKIFEWITTRSPSGDVYFYNVVTGAVQQAPPSSSQGRCKEIEDPYKRDREGGQTSKRDKSH